MLRFRTEITPDAITPRLEPEDHVLVLGSCFAENMGERLEGLGVSVEQNPLGIQYNPLSLARTLGYLTGRVTFNPEALFEHQGLVRHWDVHSRLCGATRDETATRIEGAIRAGREALLEARWLYVTLGSAHAWTRAGDVVANCHRWPQEEFTRTLLSVDACVSALAESLSEARALNPELNVLVTVSPVRYKRDGLVGRQRSKSTLILAAHQLIKSLERVSYFPAYELVLDDLRDYRFFAHDLVHPSALAVDYVWERLKESALSPRFKLDPRGGRARR